MMKWMEQIKNYNEVTGKLETEGELKMEGRRNYESVLSNGKIQMEANF